MRILIATPLYPPDVGGPATYSKLLFAGLPKNDIEVALVNFGAVRHLPKGIRHLVFCVQVFHAAKDVDLIYAQDPASVGLPAWFAAFLRRKPFLLKVVGDYAWEQGVQRFDVRHTLDTFSKRSPSGYHPFVRFLKLVETFVARRALCVVVPSKYLRTIVSNWGIPKNRIVVIQNGFRDFEVEGRKQVLRGMVKARGEIVISAGRLVPWKGFDVLIRAVPVLIKKFPDLKVLIAGDGPEMERLEQLSERLHVDTRVTFIGRQSQDVLFSYIKLADVFALATSYEGFSHQLLEVMAVGTPIVTTAVGGNPELIEDRKHGLLVKRSPEALAQAIGILLTDRKLREQLVRGAKRRVQDFSEERVLFETIALIKRFI
jgi:glycosyltransferase involved in cell wall biosynthesis